MKEASLAEGNADVVFILDRYTGPQFAGLFEDLRTWQAKDPIADFAEIPAGMRAAHTFGGKLTAMPVPPCDARPALQHRVLRRARRRRAAARPSSRRWRWPRS